MLIPKVTSASAMKVLVRNSVANRLGFFSTSSPALLLTSALSRLLRPRLGDPEHDAKVDELGQRTEEEDVTQPEGHRQRTRDGRARNESDAGGHGAYRHDAPAVLRGGHVPHQYPSAGGPHGNAHLPKELQDEEGQVAIGVELAQGGEPAEGGPGDHQRLATPAVGQVAGEGAGDDSCDGAAAHEEADKKDVAGDLVGEERAS